MYFWNIDALAQELREDTVSHDEQVKYYITATLLYMLSARIPSFGNPADHTHAAFFSALVFLLQILIVVGGILYSYYFNKNGDDKDFQVRFVALTIPATCRYLLIVSLVVIPAIALFHILLGDIAVYFDYKKNVIYPHLVTLTKFSYDLILLFLSIGYYWYLSSKIRYVSGYKKSK